MTLVGFAVVATGLSVFALVVVVLVAARVGRLLRAYDGLVAGQAPGSFPAVVGRHRDEVRVLRSEVGRLRAELQRARESATGGLCHVAVVRYDAFGDLAGALSFSAALLDDRGDGLVLSSINGRTETRTYAKGVRHGAGEAPLSPEEQEAVEQALRPAVARQRAAAAVS